MATTMFMPPPTMKYDPSQEPHTTKESFARQTTQVGKHLLVDQQLQPVVLFLPAQFQDQDQGVMTPVPLPGCPMPLMPSSTPSPGQRIFRKQLQIQPINHQEIILETVPCLIAPIKCLVKTMDMDIHHNTPAIAWPLPLLERKDQRMKCIRQDKGLGQANKVLRQDWYNMEALLTLPIHLHPQTIPKDKHRGCRLMYK